jgi:hypothetical protein
MPDVLRVTKCNTHSFLTDTLRVEKLGVLLAAGEVASIANGLNVLLLLSNPSATRSGVRPQQVAKLLPGLCATVSLPYHSWRLGNRPVSVTSSLSAPGDVSKGPCSESEAAWGGDTKRHEVGTEKSVDKSKSDERAVEEGMHACAIAASTVICHFSQVRHSARCR